MEDFDSIWTHRIQPRLSLGTVLQSRSGASYELVRHTEDAFWLKKESAKVAKITKKKIRDSLTALRATGSLEFQRNPPEGISYTVVVETGVAWALTDFVDVDPVARTYSLKTDRSLSSEVERARRQRMWQQLNAECRDLDSVPEELIEQLGIRKRHTGHSVFVDKANTATVQPPHGVTVSLLDKGIAYRDEFDEQGGIFHYPQTQRRGRDLPEIEATKNAKRLRLPLFVVLAGDRRGRVKIRRAWVGDWDDAAKQFFIDFSGPQQALHEPETADEAAHAESPFHLMAAGSRQTTTALTRPGQTKFRYEVLKRYGLMCSVCDLSLKPLLEAVHLAPAKKGGSYDARNGLPMCRNHHRAFDEHLFCIDPVTFEIVVSRGYTQGILQITRTHLEAVRPHPKALEFRWNLYEKAVKK